MYVRRNRPDRRDRFHWSDRRNWFHRPGRRDWFHRPGRRDWSRRRDRSDRPNGRHRPHRPHRRAGTAGASGPAGSVSTVSCLSTPERSGSLTTCFVRFSKKVNVAVHATLKQGRHVFARATGKARYGLVVAAAGGVKQTFMLAVH
jgi:hypothetical protein